MKSTNILICQKDIEHRNYLYTLLNGYEGFNVVGVAGTGEDALAQARLREPDVIIMDIELPEIFGIQSIILIKRVLPNSQIIICTNVEEEENIVSAFYAGASGYLQRKTAPHRLIEAIYDTIAGGSAISPLIARRLIYCLQDRNCRKSYNLNDKEISILKLLAEGLTIKVIANYIFLSIDGVKKNLKRIYVKLQVSCGKEAVAKAVREHLI